MRTLNGVVNIYAKRDRSIRKKRRRISEFDHLFLSVAQLLQDATDAALREVPTSRTGHGFDHATGRGWKSPSQLP